MPELEVKRARIWDTAGMADRSCNCPAAFTLAMAASSTSLSLKAGRKYSDQDERPQLRSREARVKQIAQGAR
ncbi:hypothetical protein BTE77_28335 [Ensifer adhaerens]|nr:hypothetical protein BTE77_28335 [Ensifer adhaerens]